MHEVVQDTESARRRWRTQRVGARSLGRAAIARFQMESVRLAWAGTKTAGSWTFDALSEVPGAAHEIEAGRALVDLADAGADDALCTLLRPDPSRAPTSWTVACYRVGDLVPHTMRDFTDPVDALGALASCDDTSHLAAELVVSTPEGLCWVALVRTGAQVRFQLLGPHSVLDRTGRHIGSESERELLDEAQVGWAAVLASWSTSQSAAGPFWVAGVVAPGDLAPVPDAAVEPADADPDGATLEVGASAAPTPHGVLALDELVTAHAVGGRAGVSLTDALFGVAVSLHELRDAITDIAASVERLDRRVGALATRLDSLAPRVSADPVGDYEVVADTRPEVREPVRRWWMPWRATRRGALRGAAARPL